MIGVHGTRPFAMALAWQAARSVDWDDRGWNRLISFGRNGPTECSMGRYWVVYTMTMITRRRRYR